MAATTKKKRNTPPSKRKPSPASKAAKKGWETRRKAEAALARKKRAAQKKRAATLARKAEERTRRSEAAKRGYRKHLARERARSALETFVSAVDRKVASRELAAIKRSWRREKAAAEKAYGPEYNQYLQFLEDLSDDVGTEWDIAYGSTDAAS